MGRRSGKRSANTPRKLPMNGATATITSRNEGDAKAFGSARAANDKPRHANLAIDLDNFIAFFLAHMGYVDRSQRIVR